MRGEAQIPPWHLRLPRFPALALGDVEPGGTPGWSGVVPTGFWVRLLASRRPEAWQEVDTGQKERETEEGGERKDREGKRIEEGRGE